MQQTIAQQAPQIFGAKPQNSKKPDAAKSGLKISNLLKFLSPALVTAGLMLTAGAPAKAWGPTGHRITGAIAENYLSSDSKAALKALLGVESLAEAATWADSERSNPDEFWQKIASPYHYVTVPDEQKYGDKPAPKEGDSITALQEFSTTLKDPKASLAEKQLALRFIIHLVGDLHQPLHVGTGLDRGGNDVKVTFYREDTNLHSVWDSGMINQQNLSFTEWSLWLTKYITSDNVKEWSNPDPLVWIAESQAIRAGVYPQDTNLRWDYDYKHLPTVKRRLQQAGVRIAAYLNKLFDHA